MTGLIERGAIALLREDEPQFIWERLPAHAQEPYLARSRACLEAFRVPTPEMKLVGARSIRDTMDTDNFTERADVCHRAMLTAELESDK